MHRNRFLICLLLLLALLGAGALLTAAKTPGGELSEDEMSALVGADACSGCGYASDRIDECAHEGTCDGCSSDSCYTNYAIESTCSIGPGQCTAVMDYGALSIAVYQRSDPGCSTDGSTGWQPWLTHYFGHECTESAVNTRCTKPNGSCNGTLIAGGVKYPGIICK